MRVRGAAVGAVVAVLVGCGPTVSGMRDARSDPHAGLTRRLESPCAKVFKLALRTAEVLHLDVTADDRANGEIVLRRGSKANVGTQGDRIAVWLDRVDGGRACEVRIYARKSALLSVVDEDWPQYFFRQMKVTADDDAASE